MLMHLPPYLEAKAEPEKLGRGKTGKILVTLDSEKLPKLGITRALSICPASRVIKSAVRMKYLYLWLCCLTLQADRTAEKQSSLITLSAKELEFVDLKPNQKKSQTIVISNTGRSDLEYSGYAGVQHGFGRETEKRVLKPGESTKMKITVLAQNPTV